MSSTLIVQLDMRTLCQEANITADWVIEIVEHGIVQPSGRTPEDWLFDDRAPVTLKRAVKLHQELELEWEGVALALELLEEVQHLRSENTMLRQRLGRFTQM
ncbi:Chaperone modulatory protein CbpM [Pseudomonas fluorescens]|uniref:Chaperone modulatory protein CbpM n=1 Tax=Pseudomonas fluorescens TaxID=294 RepID=A0A5E6T338_PSEFL|nr:MULTISPECIES: chaperone modulator CbpM [Pseudomonas]QYX52349.1 chaperone modulatory protein CbpM [Pseudomonas sp. S07E 245]VVM87621.1 Chaperone modulatory protein CbpM [Pseudomonas fluorescens]VVN23739.1 Chaperone modulatory protein CbpM [Pseudomonas fluorescens]